MTNWMKILPIITIQFPKEEGERSVTFAELAKKMKQQEEKQQK